MKIKSVKVLYMGRPLREVYPHATRWQVLKWKTQEGLKWCVRWLFKIGMVGGLGYSLFMAGAYFNPVISYAVQEKQVYVQADAPVLDRIAHCESKTGQFDQKGNVVTNTNKNGSVDVGKYQINMSADHLREMAKLGLNPLTEEGNEAYAKYLYANRGTGDWASSQSCWK